MSVFDKIKRPRGKPNIKMRNMVCLVMILSMISALIIPAYSSSDAKSSDFLTDDILSGSAVDVLTTGSALYFDADAPIRTFADGEGVTISNFMISHTYGADVYGGDTWTATSSAAGHAYEFNVNYTLGGEYSLAPGQLKIKIPLHVLKDWNGVYADSISMSIPSKDEAAGVSGIKLVYEVDGDFVVITNNESLPSGNGGNIEVSYTTTKSTVDYNDKDKSLGVFNASISIDGGTTYTDSADLDSYMDTTAKLESSVKKYQAKYESLDALKNSANIDGSLTDDGEYTYYTWKITSKVGKVTQKYNIAVADNSTNITYGDTTIPGEVVAIKTNESSSYVLTSSGETVKSLNCTKEGERTDWIITRVRKSDIPEFSADTKSYTVTNNAAVSLTPRFEEEEQTISSYADHTFEAPRDPEPMPPVFNVISSKKGIYNDTQIVTNAGNISSYELENLLKENGEIKNLKYKVNSEVYPYQYTVDPDYTLTGNITVDHPHYGVKKVKHTITDNTLALNGTELNKDAYNFTAVDFDISVYHANYSNEELCFVKNPIASDFDEDDVLYIYLRTDDNEDYHLAAEYNLYSNTANITDTAHINDISNGKITLNGTVTGYKFEFSNSYYETLYEIYPYITLKATNEVQEIVNALKEASSGDGYRTNLSNTADFVTSLDNTELRNESKTGTDYLSTTTKTSSITKKLDGDAYNQPLYRNYIVPWTITANETMSISGSTQGVEQQSGVFYDLLPESGRADLDSLRVYDYNNKELESYQYHAYMTHDYSDGRTLLTVEIYAPSSGGYTIKYNTIHPWQDILEFGRYAINYVAYETGNSSIAKGYPDNGGKSGIAGMADLDPDTNANRFIYAQCETYLNALIATTSSIEKRVAVDPDSEFTYDTVVNPSSTYVYRVNMTTDRHTTASNIYIMDSLENFVPSSDSSGSRWHGTLESIDVSRIERKGAKPVIYLSHDAPTFSAYINDISELGAGWLTVSDYEQTYGSIADARGIVIDVTKTKTGGDFELAANGTLSFDIYMRSPVAMPDGITKPEECNTYNNIYFSAKTLNIDVTTATPVNTFTHQDYTTVSFHTTGNVILEKKDYETNGVIEGIRFSLTGTSDYGTVVDEVLVTNSSGIAKRMGLERGTYYLEEIYSTPDYQRDKTIRTIIVDSSGKVSILGQDGTLFTAIEENDVTASYDVRNKERAHGDLVFYKIDSKTNNAVSGAKFTLTGTSDYGNDIVIPDPADEEAVANSISDINGKVTIADIEKGTYTLKEVEFPSGYAPIVTEYTVVCDNDGNITVTDNDTGTSRLVKDNLSGRYYIKNIPYYTFTITKVDAVNITERLRNAVFTLTLNSAAAGITPESSYVTTQTVTSDVSGYVTFSQLVPGTYTLRETTAPENHKLLTNPLTVTVAMDGTVTITGTDKDKVYIAKSGVDTEDKVKNEREYNKTVRVIKKWVGGAPIFGTGAFPVIHLSSEQPKIPDKYATINKVKFRNVTNNKNVETFAPASDYTMYNTQAEIEAAYPGFTVTDVTDRSDSGSYVAETNGGLVDYDCSKETGQVWLAKSSDGKTVYYFTNAKKVYLPKDCEELFFNDGCNLKSVNITGLYPDRVTTMKNMFAYKKGLEDGNGKNDTTYNTAPLQTIILGDTFRNGLNVTSTLGMFSECQNLTVLSGIENFETSDLTETVTPTARLTNMASMFAGCRKLTSINISSLKTSAVTNMHHSFRKCMAIQTLITDKDKFKGDSLKRVYRMFDDCQELKGLDLRGFGSCPNLTTVQSWFANCYKLEYIDLKNFVPTTFTAKDYMFQGVGKNTTNGVKIFAGTDWLPSPTLISGTNITGSNPKINLYDNVFTLTETGSFRGWIAEYGLSDYGTGAVKAGIGYLMDANSTYYTTWATNQYSSLGTFSLDIEDETSVLTAFSDETGSTDSTSEIYVTGSSGTKIGETSTYSVSELINDATVYDSDGTAYTATWSDLGNDYWACDIPVYDSSLLFYVWEDAYAGYESSADNVITPAKQTNTGTITITNTKDGEEVPEEKYGSLTLTKTLLKGGCEVVDNSTEFNFTITFTDKNNNALSGTTYLGTAVLNDGVMTKTLTGGQSFTITDIPEGWHYSITESETQGFTKVANSNATGEITADTEKNASFTNSVNVGTPVQFSVSKNVKLMKQTLVDTVSGGTYGYVANGEAVEVSPLPTEEANKEFQYTAVFTGLDRYGSYKVKTDEDTYETQTVGEYTITIAGETRTFYSDISGNANVDFTLKSGQTAVFGNIKQGAVCTVTEKGEAEYVPQYTVGEAEPQAGTKNTDLSTSALTLNSNTEVTFTNTKTTEEKIRSTISVSVTKSWQKSDGTTITADDPEAAELPNAITVLIKQLEKIFQYKDQNTNEDVYELVDKGYSFSAILERTLDFTWSTEINGLYKYSSRGNEYVYQVSEPNVPGFKTDSMTNNGQANSTNGTVTIVNKKIPSYDFTLTKTVKGNMGNRAQKFTFSLVFTNTGNNEVDGFYDVYDANGDFLRKIAVNGGYTADVTLSSGESIVIKRLPQYTKITVQELDGEEYATTYNIDNGTETSYLPGNSVEVELNDNNHTLNFTNTRSSALPTGAKVISVKFTLMALIGIGGMIFLSMKKRRIKFEQ